VTTDDQTSADETSVDLSPAVQDRRSRPSVLYVATIASTIRHFLIPYANHLRAMGWRVDAAANGATDDPRLVAAFDRVNELPLSRSILDGRGLLRGEQAMEAILSDGYDIVHVHTPIASFITRLAVRRMRPSARPSVVYTAHGFHFHHGGSPVSNLIFRTAERVAGRWTDRLIVINEEDREAALRHRIVPASRLIHLPGIGLDTSAYAPARLDADGRTTKNRAGVPTAPPLFIVMAELRANKRVGDVVRAVAAMRHRDVHLLILGTGPDRARTAALIEELGLADRVRLLGFVEGIQPILAGATALVLASRREGLARSIMEALALEVPVVASSARGNTELVGRDGFVVPVGDVAGLATSMDWLIDHPAERAEMGRRGRQRMVERFDLRPLIEAHEALYRSLLRH